MAEVQVLKTVADDMGFQTEQLVTIAKVRCNIEFDDRLMREVFKDDGVNATFVKIFTFRYFEGLTTKHRMLYKGISYEIYGFNNIGEQGRYLKVWAKSVD